MPNLVSPSAVGKAADFELPIRKTVNEIFFRSSSQIYHENKKGVVSGSISIPIYSASEGKACISAEFLAADDYSNSVFLRFNHEKNVPWHVPPGPNWKISEFPRALNLKAGWNHVRILEREFTPLSKVLIEACD